MLQGVGEVADLPLAGNSSKLPVQLGALSKARSSEWVSLANQPARGVDNNLSAISVLPGIDPFASLTFLAESQSFVCDEFVSAEAIVELNDTDLLRLDSSLLVSCIRQV